jgi:hypothetical protein
MAPTVTVHGCFKEHQETFLRTQLDNGTASPYYPLNRSSGHDIVPVLCRSTYLLVPGTAETTYVVDTERVGHPHMSTTVLYFGPFRDSTVSLPLSYVLETIDRAIRQAGLLSPKAKQRRREQSAVAGMRAWKSALILESLRRSLATRTIQKQFRESMGNPAYQMCKNRLLREFEALS